MDINLPKIEILVATIHRASLDFLWGMFAHNNHADFKILIINQTTPDALLVSEFVHIKVINCYEFGVAKSRNLALAHATAPICLMADDDIIYQANLKKTILEAHLKYPNAAMLSFEAVDENYRPYTNYGPEGLHNKASLRKIFTWVISFKRELYINAQVYYNAHFGFGAAFQGGEEYVFLRNAYAKELKMVHVAKTIVQHSYLSSGRLMGSDAAVFSKAALQYRFLGNLSYFWVPKYIFFLWRMDYIAANAIFKKFKLGLKGIQVYKKLVESGDIDQ